MRHRKKSKKELKEIITNIEKKVLSACHKCGEQLKKSIKRQNIGLCQNSLCKNKVNIWRNTVFDGFTCDKVSLLRCLEFYMEKSRIKNIEYATGLSKCTIWRLFNKLAPILVPRYYDAAEEIGSDNIIVQIDESKFGKRKYNKGHHVEGVWVLGMVEKTPERRIKLVVVEDRKSPTLTAIIQDSVDSGSVIHSDMWKGYNQLKENFKEHMTVNHSKCFKDLITGVDTNTIEGEWSGIKVGVPFRGRTKAKIELYLVRYMILRNFKEHPLDVLIKILF